MNCMNDIKTSSLYFLNLLLDSSVTLDFRLRCISGNLIYPPQKEIGVNMSGLKVATPYGVLAGKSSGEGVRAFMGVPYAKPPVGELRWKPPVELDKSDELIECFDYGFSAMQKFDPVMAASQRAQSEDCLTLNVWTRDDDETGKPVMVFLHGGAYVEGGSSDPMYDGTNFVTRNDVVFVTINYRVNLFGFMNFSGVPGGEDYQESGYLGVMDQVAALKWVKSCIEAFGGDPGNVTLFGESAGSGSVGLLMTAPAARGLFQKAICESGPIQIYNAPEITAPYAQEFMEMMGCSNMKEMMEKPAEEIMKVFSGPFFEKHIHEVSLIFAPTCDGTYIPRKPLKAFKEGSAKDVKLVIGFNANEFNYWGLYFKDIEKEMPLFWHEQARFHFDGLLDSEKYEQAYADAYPEKPAGERYLEYTNEIGFNVGSELMAEYQSRYNDAYLYLFAYSSKIPGMGSCHAIELPFVMHNTQIENLPKTLTGEVPPEHLADEMGDAWYAFAKSGNPTACGATEWPAYDSETRQTMVIDEKEWKAARDRNAKNREMLRGAFDDCLICE